MELSPALLEHWMRRYYFETEIDIGSSGVESFSMSELRSLLGLSQRDLDQVNFSDSRTLGAPGLRKAIADRWASQDSDRVMATHGSSEAIYLTMNSLLHAGDEVITISPCYQQLYGAAESIGCKLKHLPLDFDRSFVPDLRQLRKLLTRRTRMLVVNFPHNPTGITLTPEQQKELVDAAADAGCYLVWDAAFAEITYDKPPLPDPGTWYEQTITFGTLSKAYGLPGLRVGWCIASPEILERMVNLRDYTTLHLSPLVELIAERAIKKAHVLLGARRPQALSNLNTLAGWVEDHRKYIKWARPQGGVCAFLKMPDGCDVESFCHRLAQERRALLVPGSSFNQPDFVRLGFGCSASAFQQGLSHFSHLLSDIA